MTEKVIYNEETKTANGEIKGSHKRESSWPSVLFYIHLNILGLYGILVLFTNTSFLTILFTFVLSFLGILGATAGAHRLWAHRTYQANKPLRIFLMLCQTLAGQGSIYDWVQSHRLHHQRFKKDDDPFYSNKNFLSAQVVTQLKKYSEVQEKMLDEIDMNDILDDGVVMFQKKFYWVLYIVMGILCINAPLEYWDDTVAAAIFVTFSLRYLIVLNVCWLINSAHFIWALETNTKPSDSNMIFLVTKSFWPQYHYLLPYDYKSGEFGSYAEGCITAFIRVFAALGLATNLFTITSKAVKNGLTEALTSNKSVAECVMDEARMDLKNLPEDHFLSKDRFF